MRYEANVHRHDYAGYKALFTTGPIELAFLAHIRHEFFDVHAVSGKKYWQFAGSELASRRALLSRAGSPAPNSMDLIRHAGSPTPLKTSHIPG